MIMLLRVFTDGDGIDQGRWINASETVALTSGKLRSYAKLLCKWCCTFMKDEKLLPMN
jgi:hypothetical protein